MKKQMLSLFLALALTGCAAPGPGSTSAPAESGAAPAGSEAPASASQEESGYDRREAIERPEIGAEVVIDPPYDFDPAEMVPGDFGDYFTDCDYPTQVSTYKLAEGTDIENEVTVLQGEEEGPTIYIVAGVHGDEIAGWMSGGVPQSPLCDGAGGSEPVLPGGPGGEYGPAGGRLHLPGHPEGGPGVPL